jgi:protein involved in polysaccharide export with SLBB domain
MSTAISITVSTVVAAVFGIGCRSPTPSPANSQVAYSEPSAPASQSFKSQAPQWTVPPTLTTFGTPTASSIRVAVFGGRRTVQRPGYYHLPSGAVVRDAVEAAGGLRPITWWIYSGIQRSQSDGSWQLFRFTRNRTEDEQISLRDGDEIYFGREVY